jgi:hypothetical protein
LKEAMINLRADEQGTFGLARKRQPIPVARYPHERVLVTVGLLFAAESQPAPTIATRTIRTARAT